METTDPIVTTRCHRAVAHDVVTKRLMDFVNGCCFNPATNSANQSADHLIQKQETALQGTFCYSIVYEHCQQKKLARLLRSLERQPPVAPATRMRKVGVEESN